MTWTVALMHDKLSIVVLLNDRNIPYWFYSGLDNLVKSHNADLHILISAPPEVKAQVSKQRMAGRTPLRLIEKLDSLIFRTKNNYNIRKDVSELVNIAGIYDNEIRTGDSELTLQRLEERLLKIGPDIIFKFGDHYLNKTAYKIPRYGIWTYTIESDLSSGGFDSGLWEVVRYTPISYSGVEVTGSEPGQITTLFGSAESTCPFSINMNRNKLFWRASLFLPRLVEGLRFYGEDYLVTQKKRYKLWKVIHPEEGEARVTFWNGFRDVFKFVVRVMPLVMNKLIYTDAFSWQLMIKGSEGDMTSPDFYTDFKPFRSPRGLFWADPFVVSENGSYFVFVEEFIYRRNKAHIAVVEIGSNGELVRHQKIIEKPYHMSYPFIFREGGSWYMIPETSSNNTIEMYRCAEFPDTWEFDRIIMKDISATDTTLFYHDGKWWLFTTIDQTGSVSGGSTELFLFYADTPLTDNWVSHPLNPVVSDESSARCAGNLFLHNGHIYRPAQDCTMRYGRGFNLKRVTILNENEYTETTEAEIKPVWDKRLKGTHTFNFVDGLTVIDTYSYHRRLYNKTS